MSLLSLGIDIFSETKGSRGSGDAIPKWDLILGAEALVPPLQPSQLLSHPYAS